LNYQEFEIIVVDDGSTDDTEFLLRSIDDPRLRVIKHQKNLGLSHARNTGVTLARHGVVAFIDDDCVADPDWLKFLVDKIEFGGASFVAGQTYYVSNDYHGYFPERVVQNKDARWPMGCNMAYRKAVFSVAGGFSHYYYQFKNEDTEMAIRALSLGFTWQRAPQAVVFHEKSIWDVRALLRSAKNIAIWSVLKKKYSKHFKLLKPHILCGVVVEPLDYLYILLCPILVPILLVRYLWRGKRDMKIFLAKWPVYFFLRRYYVYREAIKNKVVMF
jgi:glycosyltransferase involved in cell wall biosynthesis